MTLTNFYFLNEPGSKKNQEDFIWPHPRSVSTGNRIFIVCDGVGGSSNGEIASRMVAEFMGNALTKTDPLQLSVELVNNQLIQARNALSQYARAQNGGNDMATTFTLLLLHTDKAFVAWCGDSRVYHFRNGSIIYKTQDHSLVNSLVKSGEISELDAIAHPQKNIILKAIKADSEVIDAEGGWTSEIQDGDFFLLCTDGLLENWTDEELSELLAQNGTDNVDLAAAINEKSLHKTRDNYSMYLLQVATGEKQLPPGKKKNARLVFFIVLLALVLTAVAYALNRTKESAVVVLPPATKQELPVTKRDTPAMVIPNEPARAKLKDTVQAPVRFEITNPEKTIVLPAKTDSSTKKKTKKLKLQPVTDAATSPSATKQEIADSIHQ